MPGAGLSEPTPARRASPPGSLGESASPGRFMQRLSCFALTSLRCEEPVPALELQESWQKRGGVWKAARGSGSRSLAPCSPPVAQQGCLWLACNHSTHLACNHSAQLACSGSVHLGILHAVRACRSCAVAAGAERPCVSGAAGEAGAARVPLPSGRALLLRQRWQHAQGSTQPLRRPMCEPQLPDRTGMGTPFHQDLRTIRLFMPLTAFIYSLVDLRIVSAGSSVSSQERAITGAAAAVLLERLTADGRRRRLRERRAERDAAACEAAACTGSPAAGKTDLKNKISLVATEGGWKIPERVCALSNQ